MSEKKFHSGFVAVIGRANSGKSTLVNSLVGEKVAIVSPKPQTTRTTIRGVVNGKNSQIVLVDTPGLHRPVSRLGSFMDQQAKGSVYGVNVVLLVIDASRDRNRADEVALDMLQDAETPVIAVLNKTDLVKKQDLLTIMDELSGNHFITEIIPISALKGDGLDVVLTHIKQHMPEGPMYFPEDEYTDQPEKVIAAEMIRESALYLLHDEIPHGVGLDIRSMKYKPSGVCEIHADLLCDKASHKGIIIGKQGSMLKNIGTKARMQIQRMLGAKVNLKIWVRVKPNWQNSVSIMKDLGYHNE
ncbi:MAG: GTPase Era [Clostridiales bacterium]|nr:GTPase Era [Clostridiales bacterium]